MDSLLPMREIWDIIDGWLVTNTPWISDSFAPPATDEQLKATEDTLGFALPEDVRQSYRIHNGHRRFDHRTDRGGRGFVYGDDLQTLEWIPDCWKLEPIAAGLPRLRDTVGPVRREIEGVRWIPLTSGANHMYYLDMDPAPGGDVGQIVLYIYDEVKAVRVNNSWKERLQHLLRPARAMFLIKRPV